MAEASMESPDKLILKAIRRLGPYASHARIQAETGLGRGSVDHWLGRLEDSERIAWERDWKGRRIVGGATILTKKRTSPTE